MKVCRWSVSPCFSGAFEDFITLPVGVLFDVNFAFSLGLDKKFTSRSQDFTTQIHPDPRRPLKNKGVSKKWDVIIKSLLSGGRLNQKLFSALIYIINNLNTPLFYRGYRRFKKFYIVKKECIKKYNPNIEVPGDTFLIQSQLNHR